MKRFLNRNKKGFTIVELVIVIGVIGILSAILIPTFVNLNSKASDAALKSDLAAVYSSYVADAADGYIGGDGTGTQPGTKVAKIYGQQEVALSKQKDSSTEAVYYVYDTEGWNTTATASHGAIVSDTVDYSGYYIYLKA